MKETQFTTLEKQVLDSFIEELYAEPGFSDVSPRDLVKPTGIKMSSLRGVLGSLTKKGVIDIIDKEDLGSSDDIIYLNEDYFYLHPEWSKEI